jgi:hypothetical protein
MYEILSHSIVVMFQSFRNNDITLKAQKIWKQAVFFARTRFKKRCDPQSMCAKCARQILCILRQFHTQHITSYIYDTHNEDAKEARDKIYCILNSLDPESGVEIPVYSQLLESHRCNRFACLIMEEAITIYQEFNIKELETMSLTSTEKSVMESLENILEDIKSDRYTLKSTSVELDRKLDVFELKFKGYGIEYLKKLAETRTF